MVGEAQEPTVRQKLATIILPDFSSGPQKDKAKPGLHQSQTLSTKHLDPNKELWKGRQLCRIDQKKDEPEKG